MIPFKGRTIDDKDEVEVYRNLHKGGLSVRQGGKVVAHTEPGEYVELLLANMIVSKAGKERVRRERKKNVHAWIKGLLMPGAGKLYPVRNPLTYNPYKHDSFVNPKTGQKITHAYYVLLNEREAFYASYFTASTHANLSHPCEG